MQTMKVDVPIRGMHCAACVSTVEQAARSTPGVSGASANLAAERATLEVDPATFRAGAMGRALQERGYRLAPTRRVFRIQDLDPSRVASLETRLLDLPGVVTASADYGASTISVDEI